MLLNLFQSLLNVSDDIVNVFQTYRQTDKTAVNACCNQLFVSELTVSSRSRMQNAGAYISNMNLNACQFQSVHEAYSRRSAALDGE